MISYRARRRQRVADRESGQASMVTVAMFMMLFAAIAVSFTFVVISASRQALNDSLQSSAKNAAESGVEDAKRLIVYCYNKRSGNSYTTPDAQQLCPNVIGKLSTQLEGMGCDEILEPMKGKGISDVEQEDNNRGYRVKVGNNSSNKNENNEYYQCLKIATKTDNYQGVVNNLGKSVIVPLRVVTEKNQAAVITSLKIEWHRNVTGNDGDDPAKMNGAMGTGLPPTGTWNSGNSNRPAVLRVERVGVPKKVGGFTLNELADSDTALTLRPSLKGNSSYNLGAYKPQYPPLPLGRDGIAPNNQYSGKVPIVEAKCKDNNGDYACETIFDKESLYTDKIYYLRINAIYRSTHFKITAYQGKDKLYFDGVQPLVDVTGRSSDSFSRIQARLKPSFDKNADSTNWWPEYVIDTNGKVCKDIEVQYDEGEDRCPHN
ncbi:pilus assembly PilX N-terminal domain-containing protein [Candidatus Nanoperiomorbus periodonticus]|uniref:pilus assembly PilX N-terminal domain-containing protein n=1 Tax=Candidatus Nanoperiomorbus periodonticus TaxID=2171989 RepID=UPI00101DF9F7|nr:pilus assembly PilX N-terminal domain-containing protein [Candidatus Nanoperiomorbus periodonticus]RYC75361.1 hypothetical protein G52EAM_00548 [Candidatus Nanoperiomorbus periodonticus]